MYRRHSRNSKTTKLKNMRKHKKQINEIIGALNKNKNETENTINRDK
jgi:flagellar biosynthesis chaperone FliJ